MKRQIVAAMLAASSMLTFAFPETQCNAEVISIDESKSYFIFEDGATSQIMPLDIEKKGGLAVTVTQSSINRFSSLRLGLFKDRECTEQCGDYLYLFEEDSSKIGAMPVDGKGTYYLKADLTRTDDDDTRFYLTTAFASGEDRTLNSGETTSVYSESPVTFKVRAEKAGIIQLSGVTGRFSLKDASGKICTGSVDSGLFAVGKGTYNITCDADENYYTLTCKVKPQIENSGESKIKARQIAWGTIVNGTVSEGEKSADWYKVKLSKKGNVSFSVDVAGNSDLLFRVYTADGKAVDIGKEQLSNGTYNFKSNGKWKKGIYYVKAYKAAKTGSCIYALKFEVKEEKL